MNDILNNELQCPRFPNCAWDKNIYTFSSTVNRMMQWRTLVVFPRRLPYPSSRFRWLDYGGARRRTFPTPRDIMCKCTILHWCNNNLFVRVSLAVTDPYERRLIDSRPCEERIYILIHICYYYYYYYYMFVTHNRSYIYIYVYGGGRRIRWMSFLSVKKKHNNILTRIPLRSFYSRE